MEELPWYAELREQWRPDPVRVVLVGESAPDPDTRNRRFFYAPRLDAHDNLFRGVVEALYERIPRGMTGAAKAPWLTRLRRDGVFLIDLCPYPVNKPCEDERAADRLRAAAHREHAPSCVQRAVSLEPDGVIICHTPSYRVLADRMRAEGLRVLHDAPIPFPLGNKREQFVRDVREALQRL